MKKTVKIFVFISIGFISNILLVRSCHQEPFVYITIKNDSSKNIEYVKVIDKENDYIQLTENIVKQKSRNMRFYLVGEGSFRMEVKFEDDTVIYGGAGYVETGYKVTALIKPDKIETDIDVGDSSSF